MVPPKLTFCMFIVCKLVLVIGDKIAAEAPNLGVFLMIKVVKLVKAVKLNGKGLDKLDKLSRSITVRDVIAENELGNASDVAPLMLSICRFGHTVPLGMPADGAIVCIDNLTNLDQFVTVDCNVPAELVLVPPQPKVLMFGQIGFVNAAMKPMLVPVDSTLKLSIPDESFGTAEAPDSPKLNDISKTVKAQKF